MNTTFNCSTPGGAPGAGYAGYLLFLLQCSFTYSYVPRAGADNGKAQTSSAGDRPGNLSAPEGPDGSYPASPFSGPPYEYQAIIGKRGSESWLAVGAAFPASVYDLGQDHRQNSTSVLKKSDFICQHRILAVY
jgi:hypothetical protein